MLNPGSSDGVSASSSRWAMRLALAVVVIVALVSRLRAPVRLGVTNDEMHHLESWRNRYRTSDIYPLFIERLEESGKMAPARLSLLKRMYASSPVVQRALIVLVDPHPPLFPVLAEIIEAISHSNLYALRSLSVLASLGAIALVYLLGRRLGGPVLGLWMAGFYCASFLGTLMAGIGRPYALAQCGLAGLFYVHMLHEQEQPRSSWRLLLVALLTQLTQWMTWAVVGPVVVAELVRRIRGGTTVRQLLRVTWWYLLASLILMAELMVHLRNPTVTGQAAISPLSRWATHLSAASPFGDLNSFGRAGWWINVAAFGLLILSGAAVLLRGRVGTAATRTVLLAGLVASLLAPAFLGSSVRFWMIYGAVPLLVAAIGVVYWLGQMQRSVISLVALVLAVSAIGQMHPANAYTLGLDGADMPYEKLAAALRKELGPQDAWAGYPYFVANCLYRYGPLPQPARTATPAQAHAFIEEAARGRRRWLIVTVDSMVGDGKLEGLPVRKLFEYGRFLLVEVSSKDQGLRPSPFNLTSNRGPLSAG